MKLQSSATKYKRSEAGRRITVLGEPAASSETNSVFVWIKDGVSAIGDRVPLRLGRAFARLRQPRVLLVLCALMLAFSAVATHYYFALAQEIDDRLKGNYFDNSVGIFTSPFKVSIGDRLPVAELAQYLRQAGYHQSTAPFESQDSGLFSIQSNIVEVVPSRAASFQLSLKPVRIEIDRDGRVKSLTDRERDQRLTSAEIEGELLTSVRDGDRRKKTIVQFADIPEPLRNAVLAVEDRRFFSHHGIDWRGIARALWADLNRGEIAQGGSTVTQQLIKNAFLTADRTIGRKIKEAAMAVILESRLSKEEIFALYCNDAYLGQRGTFAVHGFAEAAQAYFGKELAELTLAESAFLAGLIHAPNRYSTSQNKERAIERRNVVIDSMAAIGAVSHQEAEAAKGEALNIKKHKTQSDYGATYFLDYAQRYVESRYGTRGLASQGRIYTTMDPRLQRAAFEAVTSHTEKLDKVLARAARKKGEPQQVQAALVALDAHTGEVLAMVGGRSYDDSQLNRATDARRQPGSTFKPFVYASALGMRSYTPASLISDRPQSFSFDRGRAEYKPSNYHGGFSNRDVTLREAFARSLNVPAVELAMRVGLGNIARLAEDCGLERPRPYPSMALGTSEVTPLELAGAYTAFANSGVALKPLPVKGMDSSTTRSEAEKVSATGSRVFSPQVAYLMTNLMQSVVDAGTASRIRAMGLKGAIAGKTGTSNDGWFVGYTPGMVCAVWVGFDDNRDIRMKSSDAALPMWADFVKQAIDLRPELGGNAFARPGGITAVDIDPATGQIASADCPQHSQELFLAGTEPFTTCTHEMTDDSLLYADVEDQILPVAEDSNENYNLITLDVCAETGLLSSSACPRVKSKTFELGKEPLNLCRGESIHKAVLYPGQDSSLVTDSESGYGKKANSPRVKKAVQSNSRGVKGDGQY